MNAVERIKAELKSRKIPVSRMEKDLGFANGYISQLRKGMVPADRLAAIAKYLNVEVDYLLYGEKEKSSSSTDELVKCLQILRDREDLRTMLDVSARRTPEQIKKITELLSSIPEG